MAATFFTGGVIAIGGAPTPINFLAVNGQAISSGSQEITNIAAGQPVPSFAGLMKSEPMISFSTTDLSTVLPVIGFQGLYFPQTTVYTTVDAYLTKISNITARVANATAEHTKFAMTLGIIVPKTLSWTQGSEASVTIEIHPIEATGLVSPWTITQNSALPTMAPIVDKFTGGKVILDVAGSASTEVTSLQGWSLDYGIEIEKLYSSGGTFPSEVHISKVDPTFTVTTKDAAVNYAAFDDGVAVDGSCDFYLRRITAGGGGRTVANDIRFRLIKGMVWSSSVGGGTSESFNTELKIKPLFGANGFTDFCTILASQTQP